MAQQLRARGVDIATRVCHVAGLDNAGRVGRRTRLARRELPRCIAHLPPLRLGMHACGSAHDWARRFRAHGHAERG